jgi:MipA family protein
MGGEVANSFPGSRTYTGYALPYLDWRKPGEREAFHSPDDGFGVTLLDLGYFKAGPVGRYIEERGLSNGNGNFSGLANVGWTVELGGFFEVWPTDWLRGRFELRQGINGHNGLDGNIEIDAIARYNTWTFAIGPRAQLGDSRYMSAYFSVTPAEAAANGRVTPFNAHGGFESLGMLSSVKYQVLPNWSVTGFGGYNRLVSSAADSPIPTRLGSKNEFIGGALIEYTFSWAGLSSLGLHF